MQKFITISFLVLYLFGNTEVGQLLNLPKLIIHYKQHKQLNTNVSFVNFLNMHYLGDDGNTLDDNEDNQLPFKLLHKPFSNVYFEITAFDSFNSNPNFIFPANLLLINKVYSRPGYLLEYLKPPDYNTPFS